jgi:uncharacterized damage-inducible protein DinB/GNAT superfamily N-acetyltransferase
MPGLAPGVEIRMLAARDSLEGLTELLHRAYAPLLARGMNFTAATQSVATTQRRIAEGQCLVAEQQRRIVGTVTVCGPYDLQSSPWSAGVPAFRDRDTAHFHQFAVAPELQRQGLGRRLVAACEQWARERGFKRMALDTAENATEMRALYRSLGYSDVTSVQWDGKTYRSVVMEKPLDHSPLRAHLRTLARYHLWATRELMAHVDTVPEADYRRDLGLFAHSVHGTLNHLLVNEQQIWYRRFAEGVLAEAACNTELEADRAALSERVVEGALAWLPLIEVWPEARLLGTIDHRRDDGAILALPFATALARVFNHGTHQRGQISAALNLLGHPGPELDMARMLVQETSTP